MPKVTRAGQLQAILDKADQAACLKFFDSATEEERRELAKTAIATYKHFRKHSKFEGPIFLWYPKIAGIAVLATCTLTELKTLGQFAVADAEPAFQILSTRRPPWLTEYAECLIRENVHRWPLVRALVRRGLCDRPQHENYILGTIVCMIGFWGSDELIGPTYGSLVANLRKDSDLLKHEIWQLFQIEGQGELSLAAHDKYLGAESDNYCWSLALKKLSKKGDLSRDRLLDESLGALNRGFAQFRVAWFSQFHELLEPTAKERLKLQDKYLLLLASPIPPTVTFALDALDIIDKERPIAADAIIESLQPVLLAKHKGTARRAVQWLDRLASREAKCKAQAASAAAQALAHEAVDVQKAAIEVLMKHGSAKDASLKKQVAQAAAGIAASLRKRLDAWLGDAAAESKLAKQAKPAGKVGGGLADLEKQIAAIPGKWVRLAGIPSLIAAAKAGRAEITALDFGPLDVPRLDPAAALAPVKDLDEWIDVCAHFLESPEEIDEGERVLEGVSRLCDQSPDDDDRTRLLGPLMKRIEKVYSGSCWPFLGWSLRDDVCGVVRAWITGKTVIAKAKKDRQGDVAWHFADKDRPLGAMAISDAPALWALSQRSQELAERAAERRVRPLLSAATHRGGWLDPLVFANRLLAWDKLGEQPPHYDAILALLRLAPDHRAAALKRIGKLKGELADVARYALGGEKPKIGKTAAVWVAAARARDPLADDPLVEKRFPGLGPGGGTAARYHWKFRPFIASDLTYYFDRYRWQVEPDLPSKVELDLPSVLMNRLPELPDSSAGAAEVRWHGALWPAGREAHLVRGTRLLANNVDWFQPQWGNKTYLEPLLDGDEPLGELARTALCLGLSAKEPGEHTLAADVLAAAISDGRVDGATLAQILATLLTTAGIQPRRWGKVFGDVARISPLHAHIVGLTLENTLAAAGKSLAAPPKDVHHVLELLLELLAETGTAVTNPATRDALTQITGSGKAAKAAKALLAIQADPDGASNVAIGRAALQGRIERARRWDQRIKS
jgi:hypothetical protein